MNNKGIIAWQIQQSLKPHHKHKPRSGLENRLENVGQVCQLVLHLYQPRVNAHNKLGLCCRQLYARKLQTFHRRLGNARHQGATQVYMFAA